jgi:hypothetical protein
VASIAWVENWLDVRGRYHSRVYAADLKGGRASGRRVISPVNVVASQISFAGTGAGPELLAWQACAPGGLTCKAQAALRPDGGGWGPVRSLGEVDPGDAPLAAMTTAGTGLVDWISEGDVRAVCAPRGASGFAAPAKRLDRSGQAAQLTLSTGPLGTAVAAWTDGVMAQSLHAALYRPPRLA